MITALFRNKIGLVSCVCSICTGVMLSVNYCRADGDAQVISLSRVLGFEWKGEETEDYLFQCGTGIISRLEQFQIEEGHEDVAYERAARLYRRLTCTGALHVIDVESLHVGSIPVLGGNVEEVMVKAMSLLVPAEGLKSWRMEKQTETVDKKRLQVRAGVIRGPLQGSGWILIFERQAGKLLLRLIETVWES